MERLMLWFRSQFSEPPPVEPTHFMDPELSEKELRQAEAETQRVARRIERLRAEVRYREATRGP